MKVGGVERVVNLLTKNPAHILNAFQAMAEHMMEGTLILKSGIVRLEPPDG